MRSQGGPLRLGPQHERNGRCWGLGGVLSGRACACGACNFASLRRRKLTCGRSLLRRLVHHPAPGTSSLRRFSRLIVLGTGYYVSH
jgi:hypothetical protein